MKKKILFSMLAFVFVFSFALFINKDTKAASKNTTSSSILSETITPTTPGDGGILVKLVDENCHETKIEGSQFSIYYYRVYAPEVEVQLKMDPALTTTDENGQFFIPSSKLSELLKAIGHLPEGYKSGWIDVLGQSTTANGYDKGNDNIDLSDKIYQKDNIMYVDNLYLTDYIYEITFTNKKTGDTGGYRCPVEATMPEITDNTNIIDYNIISDDPNNLVLDYDFDCDTKYTTDMFNIKPQQGIDFALSLNDDKTQLIINATAQDKYELSGTSQWVVNLPEIEQCDIEVTTPEIPSITNPEGEDYNIITNGTGELLFDYEPTCDTTYTLDMFKMKPIIGIDYTLAFNEDNTKLIITAKAQQGYELVGPYEWEVLLPVVNPCPIKVNFVSLSANGSSGKEKTTKLSFNLSQTIDELTLANILVFDNTRTLPNFELANLNNLGNGLYEVDINGDWDNNTKIDVSLDLEGYVFIPNVLSATLFNVEYNGNGNENNNGDETLPTTGSDDIIYATMGLVLSLISIMFFINKSKNI